MFQFCRGLCKFPCSVSWRGREVADGGAGDRRWDFILPARIFFFFLAMAGEGAEAGGLVWVW